MIFAATATATPTRAGLYRSSVGVVGGVCAGIADKRAMDVVAVRILAVLIALSTAGLGALVYVVLWVKLPVESSDVVHDLLDVAPDNVDAHLDSMGKNIPDASHTGDSTVSLIRRMAAVVCLAVVFLMIVALAPPLFPGTQWWQFWPVALLILGVFLVVVPLRSVNEMGWHMGGIVLAVVATTLLPMSLDILAWSTISYALSVIWFLVVAGVFLFAWGSYKKDAAFMVGGVACICAFCLVTLLFLSIPGHVEHIFVFTPQGIFEVWTR